MSKPQKQLNLYKKRPSGRSLQRKADKEARKGYRSKTKKPSKGFQQ